MSLATNVTNLATRIGTEIKAIYGKIGTLTSLTTTEKTNLVGAINEVKASISGAGAVINDTTPSTSTVYSSTKTDSQISTAVAGVVNSAPTTLDTLNELATALGNDANFATTTATALGNRIRFDAAQTLTGPQVTQALSNIGGAAASHTHTAANISDSTATGRSVLTATDATAARTAIGAGTSSLVIGTTNTTAKAGDYAPAAATALASGIVELATPAEAATGTDTVRAVTPEGLKGVADTKAALSHTHTASQISDSTTVGRALIVAADAAAGRTAIGAGTSSLVIGTSSGTAADGALVGDTTSDFVATFNAALL
jgi:hypothetical protein